MIRLVKTETGSTYRIDDVAKTWARVGRTVSSGNIRTEGGSYRVLGSLVVGGPMVIECEPLPESIPGAQGRLIITSRVTEISEEGMRVSGARHGEVRCGRVRQGEARF